jgi:outer membrane lipoprotein-sorting protein
MKLITTLVLIFVAAAASFARDIKSGEDLVTAMHKKYDGKWYKTLTFKQITTNYNPDGTSRSDTWYEALKAPGKLRIDIEPLDKHNGILFADGTVYSYRDGKLASSRPFVHPLLVLGFDVYAQPAATTIAQLKGMGIDLAVVHTEKWQGKDVYVVGAKQGDLATPQFWVTKKDLLFVRLFQLGGKDKKSVQETQFNKYIRSGGGWVAAEVEFIVDGRRVTSEEYSEIQTGTDLDPDLWDPNKFVTVPREYYKPVKK